MKKIAKIFGYAVLPAFMTVLWIGVGKFANAAESTTPSTTTQPVTQP